MKNCIKSILDTDLYLFTTSYAYMSQYPEAIGNFEFTDRNKMKITQEQYREIQEQFENLSTLVLTEEEKEWLGEKVYFIPSHYFEWLSTFRFEPKRINHWLDSNSVLHITVEDKLYKACLYEIAILAIVSEVICKYTLPEGVNYKEAEENLLNKINIARQSKFRFSEFGSRRRFSYDVQDFVCKILSEQAKDVCVGTSNLYLAKKYSMGISGTHPHHWFMFHGAQFGYKMANYLALEAWSKVYRGSLGIGLTDTFTSEVFLRNLDKKMARLFDGLRHDSGDPILFTDRAIKRYKELGINPLTKTIIFSDGLDFESAPKVTGYCEGKIQCACGIGTNLTNDVGGKPCNIVFKLHWCQMNPRQRKEQCVKLSDVPGKETGDPQEVELAKLTLGLK